MESFDFAFIQYRNAIEVVNRLSLSIVRNKYIFIAFNKLFLFCVRTTKNVFENSSFFFFFF